MKTPALLVCLPLLITSTGCFGPAADVVANGLVLGGPSDPAFAGLAQSFEAGVVLARPLSFTDLESNAVTDADAVWLSLDGAPVDLRGESSGLYLYDSSRSSVTYKPGASVSVHAHVDGEEGVATVVAPSPPDLSGLPVTHPAGASLVVESAVSYALLYGAVIDPSGAVVWDDRPANTEEIIADLRDAGSRDRYVFPPEAFPESGVAYGVALVGIRAADGPDFHNFETFWSNFGVGAVGTGYVTTL